MMRDATIIPVIGDGKKSAKATDGYIKSKKGQCVSFFSPFPFS